MTASSFEQLHIISVIQSHFEGFFYSLQKESQYNKIFNETVRRHREIYKITYKEKYNKTTC